MAAKKRAATKATAVESIDSPPAPVVNASKAPVVWSPENEPAQTVGISQSSVMPLIVCYGCAQRVPANTMSVIMSPTARHVCERCKPLYDSGRKLTHTV